MLSKFGFHNTHIAALHAYLCAGPSNELERVNVLVRRFAPQLRERLKALPAKLAKRSGPIASVTTSAGVAVPDIGQHFALHGLEVPVRQLFQLMYSMDGEYARSKDVPKPELDPPLLKLVAAPGMGKVGPNQCLCA